MQPGSYLIPVTGGGATRQVVMQPQAAPPQPLPLQRALTHPAPPPEQPSTQQPFVQGKRAPAQPVLKINSTNGGKFAQLRIQFSLRAQCNLGDELWVIHLMQNKIKIAAAIYSTRALIGASHHFYVLLLRRICGSNVIAGFFWTFFRTIKQLELAKP